MCVYVYIYIYIYARTDGPLIFYNPTLQEASAGGRPRTFNVRRSIPITLSQLSLFSTHRADDQASDHYGIHQTTVHTSMLQHLNKFK